MNLYVSYRFHFKLTSYRLIAVISDNPATVIFCPRLSSLNSKGPPGFKRSRINSLYISKYDMET